MISDSDYGFTYRDLFSYGDRIDAIENGFKEFAASPITGMDFLRKSASCSIQTDICFPSSIGSVGIVGAALFLMTYFIGLVKSKNRREYMV